MDENELRELLTLGHELRGVEFKGPGSRKDNHFAAKVVRAVLGMANHPDGGRVIIGVEQGKDGRLAVAGLTQEDVLSWSYDSVGDTLSEYCDPSISYEVEELRFDGKSTIVITVQEFRQVPILCKKDYQVISDKGRSQLATKEPSLVLRKGALYVRAKRKPETSEIPTQEDMRALLELATRKSLAAFVALAHKSGLISQMPPPPSDQDRFEDQLSDLLDPAQ